MCFCRVIVGLLALLGSLVFFVVSSLKHDKIHPEKCANQLDFLSLLILFK